MSLETTTALYNQLWAVLEAGASTPPLVKVGNRVKLAETAGWLKAHMHGLPSDFPTIAIEVGRRGTHSAYEYNKTLAMENPDFLDTGEPFEIERTEQVFITLKTDQVVIGGMNPLKEAVVDDLMRAGPKLDLRSLVVRFGPFAFDQKAVDVMRSGRWGEVQVTTIQFPVVMVEDGRASLIV